MLKEEMHLQEHITITQSYAQYPLNHVTYAAKEVARSNG